MCTVGMSFCKSTIPDGQFKQKPKLLFQLSENEKNVQIQELSSALEEQKLAKDTKLEEVKTKLQQKEREFEVLTQEMFKRSKSKFHEIDVLKKQLAEAERNLSRSIGKANF